MSEINRKMGTNVILFYVFLFHVCACFFSFSSLFSRWHRRRSTHHRHKKGKKYLDLFVWDSTIAMSEGRRRKRRVETAMFVTTGARNSPPHLLLKVSAIFFQPIRLWNISLANLSRARERLSSWIASSFFSSSNRTKILATFSLLART